VAALYDDALTVAALYDDALEQYTAALGPEDKVVKAVEGRAKAARVLLIDLA